MSGEELPLGREKSREPPLRGPEVALLSVDLRSLRRTAGPPPSPLPENTTNQDLAAMEINLKKDLKFQTFQEQFRSNELIHTYNALQRQKELNEQKPVNIPEFIVVNQARTYHEYFPKVLDHVIGVMERYETLRATIPSVPEEIRMKEGQARVYIQALERAVRERVQFANVLLIDDQLAKHAIREGRDTQDAM